MLQAVNINKEYVIGEQTIHALNGVTAIFNKKEFVAVLGPSGCGKTTLMNIIGGLDGCTGGDLIINGKSTQDYKDSDWNNYRNHSIGFVFQTYNLIPHLSVLGNVELALTLSGVDTKEKRQRSLEALEKVGLADQAHKRPNQLSGGQMQRVAIARAIVNRPEILLADEPTGAIDSGTSKQIMAILKAISKECLVIMVTHNQELANEFADRIIRMKDGIVVSDEQNTLKESSVEKAISTLQTQSIKKNKASMNYGTALKLSFTNLINKKGRSILTVIAGSISIICIVLILAMNSGFAHYIDAYERDSLGKYPIQVISQTSSIFDIFKNAFEENEMDMSSVDLNSMLDLFRSDKEMREKYTDEEIIYMARVILGAMDTMRESGFDRSNPEKMAENMELKLESDISIFIKDMEQNFNPEWGAVRSDYNLRLNIYSRRGSSFTRINPVYDSILSMMGSFGGGMDDTMQNQMRTMMDSLNPWSMMIDDKDILHTQYDILAGYLPDCTTAEGMKEVVIAVDEYNQIDDFTMFCLGKVNILELMISGLTGIDIKQEYDFNEFLGSEFTLMIPSDYYSYNEATGLFDFSDKKNTISEKGLTLKVSGIVRLKEGVSGGCIARAVGYTQALAEYIINTTNESDVAKAQEAEYIKYLTQQSRLLEIQSIISNAGLDITAATSADLMELVATGTLAMEDIGLLNIAAAGELKIQSVTSDAVLDESEYLQFMSANLDSKNINTPSSIYIYPSSIEGKSKIIAYIGEYNTRINADEELSKSTIDYTVTYIDELSEMTRSMKSMIDTITYILIAIAVIAVIVSMLLVAIILYISVQDRIKEIGLLRSLGASRGNVASVFIAETLIIGLISGIIGVALGVILIFPANAIISSLLGISNLLQAVWWQEVLLVGLSLVITVASGLIPALLAAKKDPVLALRTE